MQHDQSALMEAQKQPRDPLARQVGANLPQSAFQAPHQRHADGPAKLDAHQVHSDRTPVCSIKAAQPFECRFRAGIRLVKAHGHCRRAFLGHVASPCSMYHKWYTVQINPQTGDTAWNTVSKITSSWIR